MRWSSTIRNPVENVDDIWTAAAQMAVVGIFILLLGACFYFCRAILLPILAAVLIGMTFAPLVKLGAAARRLTLAHARSFWCWC